MDAVCMAIPCSAATRRSRVAISAVSHAILRPVPASTNVMAGGALLTGTTW